MGSNYPTAIVVESDDEGESYTIKIAVGEDDPLVPLGEPDGLGAHVNTKKFTRFQAVKEVGALLGEDLIGIDRQTSPGRRPRS